MTLDKAYDLLNFFVNKHQGAYFTMAELDLVVDRAQHTLFNGYYTQYATSQRLNDALAPFKVDYTFTTSVTPLGRLTMPSLYLNLLSVSTVVLGADGVSRQNALKVLNEDEISIRLKSQVNPVTIDDPVAVLKAGPTLQLYPSIPQAGILTYLRSPVAPKYGYTLVSGRVIVYNPLTSVQLEWSDKDIVSILQIALNTLGINMGEQDVLQWSEGKYQQNMTTNMKQ